MVEQARRRLAGAGSAGLTLMCSPVETADIRVTADAALFHFTHDILRRPDAIANVIGHLKPGARVVASGLKWAAPWPMRPINLLVASRPALCHIARWDGRAVAVAAGTDRSDERRVSAVRRRVHRQRRLCSGVTA